jgi:hypothetical protein
MNLLIKKSAVISDCGKYRYQLTRTWDETKHVVTFIMLNPSTADADLDDATVRKCMGFAQRWNCGGIAVGNLFAFRETSPAVMKRAADPVGPDNWHHLETLCRLSDFVVCAWGTNGNFKRQDEKFYGKCAHAWGVTPQVLRITPKTHMPEHPLYVPYETPLTADPRFTALAA